jgi:hypothetical protein
MDGSKMVDMDGYVIILVETQDKKVKLCGKTMFTDIETHWPTRVEPLTLVYFKNRLLNLRAND